MIDPTQKKLFDKAIAALPDLAVWKEVIETAKQSKFLTGKEPGRDGRIYKANVEFFLRHFGTVLDGGYTSEKTATYGAQVLPTMRPKEVEPTEEERREVHLQYQRNRNRERCLEHDCKFCTLEAVK